MKFTIENLGALDYAELELADLTIVCGQNNTGKTYVTYLVFCLLSKWRQFIDVDLSQDLLSLKKNGLVRIDLAERVEKHWPQLCNAALDRFLVAFPEMMASRSELFAKLKMKIEIPLGAAWKARNFKSELRSAQGSLLVTMIKAADSSEIELVALESGELRGQSIVALGQFIEDRLFDLLLKESIPTIFIASTERTGATTFRKQLNLAMSKFQELLIQAHKDGADSMAPDRVFNTMYVRHDYALPVRRNVEFVNQLPDANSEDGELFKQHPDLLKKFEMIVGGSYSTNKEGITVFQPHGTKLKLGLGEVSSSVRSLLIVWYWLKHVARKGEMLVLDDGWFGKRDDDNSGLGDWFVNEKKMNGSMAQLAEKIHKMGMKFGLWFEPEMISEDSDLYRAHPDWAFAIPGRVPNHSRNQLVLDMTREDVREYLLERLTTIVHDAKIDYVKWDMNRSVCDVYSHVAAQSRNGELYHRYVLGVYDLMERFLAACPNLLLEGCSGGGGRYDAGMMYYSPQIWCSDNTDAINRLSIQYGSSFFYPISTVGSHVSVCPNHQTGRVTPFRTRGDVALAGSFGYEMDLNKISEEEKEMVKEQVAAMHEYYELTHEGLYYRLTGLKKQDFMAWEFVAEDQSRALLTIVKTDAEGNMLPVHTKVCGLAEDKLYRCSLDQEVRLGRTWNRAGLTLHQVLGEYESIRVEFTEVK